MVLQQLNDASATISLKLVRGTGQIERGGDSGKRRKWKREKGGDGEQSRRICFTVSDRAIKLSQCGSDVGSGVVSQSRGQAD